MKIECPRCPGVALTPPSGSRNPEHHCGQCQRVWTAADLILAERDRARARMKARRRRGHTDALAGHGPALLGGDYMVGYRRGRAEMGKPMSHKPAAAVADETAKDELAALVKALRKMIAEVEADPRYSYPDALVEINAPLALEQVAMKSRVRALKDVLKLARKT